MIDPKLLRADRMAVQDKKTPFLINIEDGRLVPNVPQLGGSEVPLINPHPKYRPFRGNYKASLDERMAYLRSGGFGGGPAKREVILPETEEPAPEQEPFDIGKASREDLVAFAFEQYQEVLSPETHLTTLRSQVVKLVKAAQNPDPLG